MKEIFSNYLENVLKQECRVDVSDIKIENPPKAEMGDIAFGCFLLAKELKKSPNAIAEDLKNYIDKDASKPIQIERVEVLGPYLNVFLAGTSYSEDFTTMMQGDSLYTDILGTKDETIYIDYIGANVGKTLHIGHMCTPIQGQTIINVYTKMGFNVISDSHLGDWGIIFGKLIVAYKQYGSSKELEKNAVEHLFNLYVRISAEAEENSNLDVEFRKAFQLLSTGDQDMKDIWKQFTRKSIDAMNILLSRLFVFPQYNIGESFYEGLGLPKMEDYPDLKFPMREIVQELIKKGIATQNEDSSVGVIFPEDMKIPSCILQKRDGTHGYLASDLASIKYRMDNWKPKKIIYFVDARQQLHLRQTFEISKLVGWLDDTTELTHAYNGFISLKDGAMSTRKGKIIKLELLLDEAEERAKKIIQEKRQDISGEELDKLGKVIGIGAIKYGYLKKTRESDVVFDWDEFMSFEGNSGPYIQYAYVRAKKILEKSNSKLSYENISFETSEEKELVKNILGFQKTISVMLEGYHPHVLCSYVYEMTKKFSSFYNNINILGEDDNDTKNSRLVLVLGFMKIVEESFEILGIPLPDQM